MSTPHRTTTTTASAATDPPAAATARPGLLSRFRSSDTGWILLFLILLIVVFAVLRPEAFGSLFNLRNILIDASTLLVLAVGMTYVIIAGGIDLSIGSVLVVSGVVGAKTMIALGDQPGLVIAIAGIATALVTGVAWGCINGMLIAKIDLPPLIVTLATLGAALGMAQLITGGTDLRGVPGVLSEFGLGRLLGVPYLVLVAAVVAVIGGLVLAYTRYGSRTYAIGSNITATKRVGINITRHVVSLYALQGFLAGVAAVMSVARFNTTSIAGQTTTALVVIAGVVLGGTSLFGGRGTIFGTVIGILIPAVLTNGFVILGVQAFWQSIAVSVVLVLAVMLDRFRRAQRERS